MIQLISRMHLYPLKSFPCVHNRIIPAFVAYNFYIAKKKKKAWIWKIFWFNAKLCGEWIYQYSFPKMERTEKELLLAVKPFMAFSERGCGGKPLFGAVTPWKSSSGWFSVKAGRQPRTAKSGFPPQTFALSHFFPDSRYARFFITESMLNNGKRIAFHSVPYCTLFLSRPLTLGIWIGIIGSSK